ncbi:MAG TPA: immunoglobulin domain-containing protein, partial [Ohtaekwangia sp.]|nr:immunoglobulin domain-containing protein [Ohtaekwangia sp.]
MRCLMRYLTIVALFIFSLPALAQVSITGGTGGQTLCAGGGYIQLSPIIITETHPADFNIRTLAIDTLNLGFSTAGFEFEPNVGSVSFAGTGSGAVLVTFSITGSKIAIRIVEGENSNSGGINTITITGVRVRATAAIPPTHVIERILSLQEFAINGLAVGTDLAQVASYNAPTVNAGSDELGCESQPFNFSIQSTPASASSGTTISWSHNGTGSLLNSNTLTPTYNHGVGETGVIIFTLTASNTNGSCASVTDEMEFTIRQNPVITTPPATQTVCEGNTINLSVTATGTGLTYEWFRGGSTLGAPSAANTLTISNATSANAGSYTVTVRGTCNATGVTSAAATVTLNELPEVTTHPTNQTICENTNTSFTVSAGATSGAVVQWQVSTDGTTYTDLSNGVVYSNVDQPTLDLTNVPLANNGYLYRARITG